MLRLNTKPDRSQLRVFGLVGAAVAALFGGWVLAAVLAALALFLPQLLRALYVVATVVTFPIGYVVSRLILAVLYFLVITPVGLAVRVFGSDPLSRSRDPNRVSYWEIRSGKRPKTDYFNQS